MSDTSDSQRSAAESAREGVEHLRSAARELIAASRSFLDAAEAVVDHGATADFAAVIESVGSLVALFDPALGATRERRTPPREARSGPEGRSDTADDAASPAPRRPSRVRRVSVG